MVISYHSIQFFDFGEAHPVKVAKNTDFCPQARKGKEATKPSLTRPLEVIQNRCLWTIAGAYEATPIPLLESETGILLVRDYFSKLQAQYQARKQNPPMAELITSACERIQR